MDFCAWVWLNKTAVSVNKQNFHRHLHGILGFTKSK